MFIFGDIYMKIKSERKKSSLMLIFLLTFLILTFFTACSPPAKSQVAGPDPEVGQLISFQYTYGDFRYKSCIFTIKKELDETGAELILFEAEGYANGFFHVEDTVDESVLADLVKIMAEENIFAWDGFAKYRTEVKDGFSFSLIARFEKSHIKARGYVAKPANFKAGHERLSAYLLDLVQSCRHE
jgi:hypothetical protein